MSNQNLFKEAIADAKAVRDAALANAKAALEETLTPRLQSMISAKLNEMDEEEYEEEMEEGFKTSQGGWQEEDKTLTMVKEEEEELEEDFNLDGILAELEAEEETELEETKKMKKGKKEELEEGKEEEEELEEAKKEEEEEDGKEDEQMVEDLTVDQLKDIIKDIVSSELEKEEMETPAEEEAEMGMEMPGGEEMEAGEEEINLSEILAELDEMYNEDEEELEEGKIAKWVSGKKAPAMTSKLGYKQVGGKGKMKESQEAKELAEAVKTIKTLQTELHEVNLLNAKLLYVNKIFKAKNLTESQKLKVIATFDKATNTKEAKMVYESLSSTLTSKPKQTIKESLGFASKAAGVAPKQSIVETNDVISRMQKLANIK